MSQPEVQPLTEDLNAWRAGDPDAAARVLAQIYQQLRTLAGAYSRRERAGHTLQATALVHEAYLQLFGKQEFRWNSRAHFLGLAAKVMRRVLVEHARVHQAVKRGGRAQRLTLTDLGELTALRAPELLALDDALRDLAERDPRQARIVEARFFGGLNVVETAEYLGISRATVIRQWRLARAWLYGELRGGAQDAN